MKMLHFNITTNLH